MNRLKFFKTLATLIVGAPLLPKVVPNLLIQPKRTYFNNVIAFPLIRQCFPTLLLSELISVQPMSGPVSTVFFADIV